MAMIGRRPQRLREVMTAARETPSTRTQTTLRSILDMLPGVPTYTANKWASKGVSALQAGGFGPLAALDEAYNQHQATVGDLRAGRRPQNLNAGAAALAGVIPGAGMFGKGRKAATRLADIAQQAAPKRGIVAYHGSPHSFDRFSMDKIGTGEGAQAYGHGLYFAENEGVARQYRDQLAPVQAETGFQNIDVELARVHGGDWAAFKKAYPNPSPALQDAIARIEAAGGPKVTKSPGAMYQVRIDADPDDFLDWDKPIDWDNPTERDRLLDDYKGANLEAQLENNPAAIAKLSQEYAARGIPGIRYLDQGSRGAGDGSRNLVVFNERLISILKKYGWVPGTAVPAALMAQAQAEAGRTY